MKPRYIIYSILFTLIVFSCKTKLKNNTSIKKDETVESSIASKEKFKLLNVDEFNKKAAHLKDAKLKEILCANYSCDEEGEGVKREFIPKKISDTKEEITFISSGGDDSVQAEKYIISFELKNSKWVATEIRYNWKCWEDRGHTNWGIELCN